MVGTIISLLFGLIALLIAAVCALAFFGVKIACKILFNGLPFVTAFFAARQIMAAFPILAEQSDGHPHLMTLAVFAGVSVIFLLIMRIHYISLAVSQFLTASTLYMAGSIIFTLVSLNTMGWRIIATGIYIVVCWFLLKTNQRVVTDHWDTVVDDDDEDDFGFDWFIAVLNTILAAGSVFLIIHAAAKYIWFYVVPSAVLLITLQFVVVALASFLHIRKQQMYGL